jgi:hypothetical protein
LNPWIDPRIGLPKPERARASLPAHDREQKPYGRPQLWAFDGPIDDDGKPLRLFVPGEEKGGDYVRCTTDPVTAVAQAEDRYAVDADRGRDAAIPT